MSKHVQGGGKRRGRQREDVTNPVSEEARKADEQWQRELSDIRGKMVEHARSFQGMTYGKDSIVCTDTYVWAAEKAGYPVSEEMEGHFNGLGGHAYDVYSRTDVRWRWGVRHLKLLADWLRGTSFNNRPDNEYFTRRLQNLRDWQTANSVYWSAEEVEAGKVEPRGGMAVYWKPKNPGPLKSNEPTHVGVVSEVKDGGITKVVQASSRRGVVEDPHGTVLKSMDFVGVGDLPKPRLRTR